MPAATTPEPQSTGISRKRPFYMGLSFQVLVGVGIAIILGYASPATAVSMKPLGDAFIRLITMIITLVIFCTLVTGIAGMEDMKKWAGLAAKRFSISKWFRPWRCFWDWLSETWCIREADSM